MLGTYAFNYIKLINSLILVAINFLETYGHVSNTRNSIFGFNTGIQFRTGYQNQAKSSLEQGQISGGLAAHPHQNFCSQFSTTPAPGNRHANIRLGFMLKLGYVYSDFQYQSITDSSNREI